MANDGAQRLAVDHRSSGHVLIDVDETMSRMGDLVEAIRQDRGIVPGKPDGVRSELPLGDPEHLGRANVGRRHQQHRGRWIGRVVAGRPKQCTQAAPIRRLGPGRNAGIGVGHVNDPPPPDLASVIGSEQGQHVMRRGARRRVHPLGREHVTVTQRFHGSQQVLCLPGAVHEVRPDGPGSGGRRVDGDERGDACQHARLSVCGQRSSEVLEIGDDIGLHAAHGDAQADVSQTRVGKLALHRGRGDRRQVQRRAHQARRAQGDDRGDSDPSGRAGTS